MSNLETRNQKPEKTIVYQGKIFEVIHFEGKPGVVFEVAVRAPGVRLLIETEKNGQRALLMTRERRREADGWDVRLPGGKVFNTLQKLNEYCDSGADMMLAALQAAKNEGFEEAGITGGDIAPCGLSRVGSTVEWDLYYFVVKNAYMGDQNLEDDEQGDIETVVLTASEIFEKLTQGDIGDIQEGRSAHILWKWLHKNDFIAFRG